MDTELEPTVGQCIDLFGPSVEFLTPPGVTQESCCVLRGVIPPGVSVPLHSHADIEDFYVISGEVLAVTQEAYGYQSTAFKAGDYIRVPSGVRHGWRNISGEPLVALIVTTATLGKFFFEAGRPVEQASQPPTHSNSKYAGNVAKCRGAGALHAHERPRSHRVPPRGHRRSAKRTVGLG